MGHYNFDSMCLSTYKARQLGRYHPYWCFRPTPASKFEGSQYFNTIYDEDYVVLEVPTTTAAVPPLILQNEEVHFEEERERRAYRFRIFIVDLVLALKHAIGA